MLLHLQFVLKEDLIPDTLEVEIGGRVVLVPEPLIESITGPTYEKPANLLYGIDSYSNFIKLMIQYKATISFLQKPSSIPCFLKIDGPRLGSEIIAIMKFVPCCVPRCTRKLIQCLSCLLNKCHEPIVLICWQENLGNLFGDFAVAAV